MKVSLEYITPDAAHLIGRFASICYDSNISRESCIKRAASCKEKGHLATLRFAHAVFHVSDISRACSHQFVRSKHLDFLQRSQRYCKEETPTFTYPGGKQDYAISVAYNKAYKAYQELLNAGVKKEDARLVLPAGISTELYVVGNLQAWVDFIKLRAEKHAQWEIRQVAIAINNLLAKECPELFEVMYGADD